MIATSALGRSSVGERHRHPSSSWATASPPAASRTSRPTAIARSARRAVGDELADVVKTSTGVYRARPCPTAAAGPTSLQRRPPIATRNARTIVDGLWVASRPSTQSPPGCPAGQRLTALARERVARGSSAPVSDEPTKLGHGSDRSPRRPTHDVAVDPPDHVRRSVRGPVTRSRSGRSRGPGWAGCPRDEHAAVLRQSRRCPGSLATTYVRRSGRALPAPRHGGLPPKGHARRRCPRTRLR